MNDRYYIKQSDGSIIELRDLQKSNLDILEFFDKFCSNNNLKYSLCGGGCIGAIRHGGFIPWDDDIDVHMLRDDYERLYELWNEQEPSKKYRIVRTTKECFYDTMLTQISNQHTTFIKENQAHLDIDHGIKLEIIPLDGAPNHPIKRKIQLFWALLFYLFNRGFAPENRGRLAHYLGKAILFFFKKPESRVRVWRFAEKRMTKYPIEESDYLTELCVTWKYMKIMYPKEIFMKDRRARFENGEYSIPFKAEEYLQLAFGDYSKLPPESERIPKHQSVYIDLHKPYKDYRGLYYYRKNEGQAH